MNTIRSFFWNSQQQRFRAVWRILLQIALLFPLTSVIGFPFIILEYFYPSTFLIMLTGISGQVAFLISVWLASRWIDKRKLTDFGLHLSPRWWRQFGFGLLLGALLMAGVFLVEKSLGYVTISDTFHVSEPSMSFWQAIWLPIGLFILVGFAEELLSRGYHLRNMAEGFHFGRISPKLAILLALILSSVIFGIGHASNPNATVVSSINIAIAGIFLGLGLILLDELAIPIGLHITWNFFQGNVFGFPVSGTSTVGGTFIQIEQSGPVWFTGGAFGPEAGVIGLVAMAIGMLAIVLYARWERGSAEIDPSIAIYHPASSQQTHKNAVNI